MCGIAGSVGCSLPVEALMRSLHHRGPDEQQYWEKNEVRLIHARLAIQELGDAGRQPMHYQGVTIIFNGEIYNHLELRKQFNLTCSSHSDTETLLHLYKKLGLDMLQLLDGMFAIALYDEPEQQLFLIRDRAGEKPLYYYSDATKLVFASELSSIYSVLKPSINHQCIANFMAVGYLPNHETPYEGVVELLPGSYLCVKLPTLITEYKIWWSISPAYHRHHTLSYAETIEEVERLLMQSVKRRLLSSDLEVGTFLSGGIDSGLVTAMAAQCSQQLKTFTVSFEGAYNEAPLAALVAKKLGTKHHELSISLNSLENDLENIFANYGEPIMDDSIIPSYYVAREAKKHLTVILNGDAGDELFGGYRRYVPFTKMNLFSSRWSSLAQTIQNLLPAPRTKMNYYNYAYRLLSLMASTGNDVYFSATNDLLHKAQSVFKIKPNLQNYAKQSSADKMLTPLQQLMMLDFNYLLPSTLLVKMDIATMANSLEGRSPFLSKELLEFVPGLPDRMKIKRGTTKFLLRDLAKRYLPNEIINQPKRGFEIPLQHWIDNRLKAMVEDYLIPSTSYIKEILDPAWVDTIVLNKANGIPPEQRARIIFAMLSVECWKKSLKV